MRLITLAIHTYDRALAVRMLLEAEGIPVTLQNVNLEQPEVSSGVRVRIPEQDLPLALRIVENPEIFSGTIAHAVTPTSHRCVLVPIDFSEYSFNAAKVAVKLASARKADIVFLHSYIDPRLSGSVQLSDNLTYDVAETEATEHLVA
ncbi:MAG: universal stress protein, partial [Muribaculaceae bacterium]|nr:universal stress protein [Muribaculaceae bacterium]